MKALLFLILGTIFIGLGIYLTAANWYIAAHQNKIYAAQAYTGPVLFALGAFRILSSASILERNFIFRVCAIGIGFLLAVGNHAALKAVYPDAQEILSHHTN